MSHFTVLVVGDDVEGQLAPYDENIQVEPYRDHEEGDPHKHWSVTSSREAGLLPETDDLSWAQVASAYNQRWSVEESSSEYINLDADGRAYTMSTYNPKSQWDWWTIGGRWAGFFKLRQGAELVVAAPKPHWGYELSGETPPDLTGKADQAYKRDIDFLGMRRDAQEKAAIEWDRLVLVTAGIAPPSETWTQTRERINDIDEARRVYNGHPWIQAVRKDRELDSWDDPVENYHVLNGGKNAFVKARGDRACSTYAVVKDGQWYAKGKIGWFGFGDEDMSQEAWSAEIVRLIENLPADTLLTVVDCHI